ncbi:PAS domain S-box protein [Methylobacter sp. Wu8]|uniref:PAS domain S-box protein n=1 Tax=Methylobacter sp. Wu8 TaxID=3118457 RepID=UPI002F2CDEDE
MHVLIDFFGKDLIPHNHGPLWSIALLWAHVISDLLAALFFYFIPPILFYFIRQHKEVSYSWPFAMLSGFFIASGTTHLLSVITLWIPLYWLSGLFKILTAIFSVAAALSLLWLVPRFLSAPGMTQLLEETQQKKAAEEALQAANAALQKNIARTQRLLDLSLGGIISIDHNGIVIDWNVQAEHIFGYSREQALGQELAELIVPPAYREPHRQGLSRFMATGSSNIIGIRFEITGLRADASEFPIELTVDVLGQKGGYFYTAYVRDITERKMIEEALRESENKLTAILDNVDAFIYIKDCNYRYQYANQPVRQLFGKAQEDIVGKLDEAFFDQATAEKLRENDRRVIELGECVATEEINSDRENASTRVYFSSKQPLRREDGGIYGLCGVSTDITERKQMENALIESEYRWKFAIEGSGDGLWDWSVENGTVFFSKHWKEMLGFAEDEIGTGLDEWEKRIHPDDKTETIALVQACLEGRAPIYTSEHRIRCKDGYWKWILDRGMVVSRNEDGKPLRMIGTHTDISERKQMEEARKEALDRLQKIASRLPGVIYQYRLRPDGSSCFPFASEAIREIYRISPDEVSEDASKVFAVLHPDDYDGIASAIQKSARNLTPWRHEYRVKFDDGTVRWLLGNALPQREEDGSTLWYGFITDITGHKQMEEKLRDSDAINTSILNSLTSSIVVLDTQGVIIAVNNAWRQFADENGGQNMLGLNYLDACKNTVNQPDGDLAIDAQRGIAAVLAGELETFHLEYPCHSPDQQRWFYMNVAPLQGSRRGAVVSHENITERKKAEDAIQAAAQYARSLIEASLDPLVTISTEGKITDVNTATEQVTGVERDQLIGSDFADYFTDPKEAREGYQRVFSEDFVFDYPLAIRHVSGQITDVLYNASVYHDGKGKVLGVFAAARDITEFKQIEAELTRSNAELEQFAYAVSHDMRQPLRMVTSYLTLIENALSGQLNEETQQFLDFAVNGAKRMDAMILSLLDYSRVGRVFKAKIKLSSKASLDEALAFLNPELSACGGEIKVTGDWPELVASRDELTRLLQNLIANALKYHEENQPPKVHIHGESRAGSLRVEVRDQGIGIEPGQMNRLFKVFSRLQARSRFEGTGVGLALCRKIVEHHGGAIGVESAGDGQGAVFWFELPLVSSVNPA